MTCHSFFLLILCHLSRILCYTYIVIVVVQSLSHVQLFTTPWTAARQASLSFTVSQSLLKLMSIESVMPSNHPSSVIPFSCPQSFPTSGCFPASQLFASGGQRTGVSTSASVLTANIQGWLPLGLAGLITLLSKGLSRVFSSTTIQKHQFISIQPPLGFPGSSAVKESTYSAGDPGVGKIPWRRDRLPIPVFLGFPGCSDGKESACNVERPGFNPWVGKIPCRRERLPTLVFWPGELDGLLKSTGSQRVGHNRATFTFARMQLNVF